MIIVIITTVLMLAISLSACFKWGEDEGIVQYGYKED